MTLSQKWKQPIFTFLVWRRPEATVVIIKDEQEEVKRGSPHEEKVGEGRSS